MADLAPPKVIITRDLKTAVMSRGQWRSKVPVTELHAWLDFYRRLAARRPSVYAAWIEPIEKAMKLIEERKAA